MSTTPPEPTQSVAGDAGAGQIDLSMGDPEP